MVEAVLGMHVNDYKQDVYEGTPQKLIAYTSFLIQNLFRLFQIHRAMLKFERAPIIF